MEMQIVVTRGLLVCGLLGFGLSTGGFAQSASHEESTSPVDYVREQADNPALEPAVRKMAREALPKTDESKEASKKNGTQVSGKGPGQVKGKTMPMSVRSHRRTASVPATSSVKQSSPTKRAATPDAEKVAKKGSVQRSSKASSRVARTRRTAVKSSTKKPAQKKVATPVAPSASVSVVTSDAKTPAVKKPVAKKVVEKTKVAAVDAKKEAAKKSQVMHDDTDATVSAAAQVAEIERKKAEIAKRKKDIKEQAVAPFAPVAKKVVADEDTPVTEKQEKVAKKNSLSHSPSAKKLETKEGKSAVVAKKPATPVAEQPTANGKPVSATLKKIEKKGDIKLMDPITEETVVEVDEESASDGSDSSDSKDATSGSDDEGAMTDALGDEDATVV
jgi:hypothetical protein